MSTKTLTPIEIFDQIEIMILEEPKRIRMEYFAFNPDEIPDDERPACNTVGCIGGWAVAIGLKRMGAKLWATAGVEYKAQELLELDEVQAERLFYEFPRELPGTQAYAKAVVAHMEKFRKSVPHLRRKV